MEMARGQLEDEVAALGGGAVPVLRAGSPADEIVSAAEEIGADLVVVGSHGHRGVRRALLGSVAENVVRLSPVPVLTFHSWHFESRAEAARELAAATDHLRAAAPAVIAVSRGALVLAAEIGRHFGEAPDLLLATSVARDGVPFGGMCEDGTVRIDPEELARAPSDPDRDLALANAKKLLSAESTALRGSQWIGDVWHRAVVLVSDAIEEPWSILAACDALRRQGASPVIVAAPIATWVAAATLEGAVDQLIVLRTTNAVPDGLAFYRDARPLSRRAAVRCLHPEGA